MMGRRKSGQGQFFYSFDLDKVVPPDHLVRQIGYSGIDLREHSKSASSKVARCQRRCLFADASRSGYPKLIAYSRRRTVRSVPNKGTAERMCQVKLKVSDSDLRRPFAWPISNSSRSVQPLVES